MRYSHRCPYCDIHKGRLVEKSSDLAKYWAFKAILNGNNSAVSFYKTLVSNI